jgi:hypothetical protein
MNGSTSTGAHRYLSDALTAEPQVMQQLQQLCREAETAAAEEGGGEGAAKKQKEEEQGEGSLPAVAMSVLVLITNLVQTSSSVRQGIVGRCWGGAN